MFGNTAVLVFALEIFHCQLEYFLTPDLDLNILLAVQFGNTAHILRVMLETSGICS